MSDHSKNLLVWRNLVWLVSVLAVLASLVYAANLLVRM